ncbi:PKD domain-containing protein [Capnocytophaga ochracea]|uniref:PKD domain-containing protein n=1 Tax=Capnocytophaga ochracea TaxID=1018 RepID=A0AA46ZZT7_CAPOC|nr:PKD domain-containing protein [Capnocytophaga ochracea]UZD41874.1 PKD domain-containing protein [Capnocytophaga ochracea]
MRLVLKIVICLALWFCFACEQEQNMPIEGDFSIAMVDDNYNVPAQVRIINKITGADAFQWEFPNGSYTSSNAFYPEDIRYTEPGTYTITAHTTNLDGEARTFQKSFTVYPELSALFSFTKQGSDIAPLTLTISNQSEGATTYQWSFEGGTPAYSSEKNPTVTFEKGGIFTLRLEASNHSQRRIMEKTVVVRAPLVVAFEMTNEYPHNTQAPVRIFLKNQSVNATAYRWKVSSGAFQQESTDENPSFILPTAGTYQIELTANNDKQTLSERKNFTVTAGDNLIIFTDIKLGINTNKTVGCYFSSFLGEVLKPNEVTAENGRLIDFVYFGQSTSFAYNVFLSPDEAQTAVFDPIPNATKSYFINKQENKGQVFFSVADFDALSSGATLSSLSIKSNSNKAPFNKEMANRIVLFETANGRKGAIKIKEYVSNGAESYLVVDIKMQKNH